MTDEQLMQKIVNNGKKTAQEWSWNKSIDLLEEMIEKKIIKTYYNNEFPEKYDYVQVMRDVYEQSAKYHCFDDKQMSIMKQKNKMMQLMDENLKKRNDIIKQKDRQIQGMQTSSFWKIRNQYINFKNKFK